MPKNKNKKRNQKKKASSAEICPSPDSSNGGIITGIPTPRDEQKIVEEAVKQAVKVFDVSSKDASPKSDLSSSLKEGIPFPPSPDQESEGRVESNGAFLTVDDDSETMSDDKSSSYMELLIEKITVLHDSNNVRSHNNSLPDAEYLDEWEDDEDTGYLVIPLTDDEFFELEEVNFENSRHILHTPDISALLLHLTRLQRSLSSRPTPKRKSHRNRGIPLLKSPSPSVNLLVMIPTRHLAPREDGMTSSSIQVTAMRMGRPHLWMIKTWTSWARRDLCTRCRRGRRKDWKGASSLWMWRTW